MIALPVPVIVSNFSRIFCQSQRADKMKAQRVSYLGTGAHGTTPIRWSCPVCRRQEIKRKYYHCHLLIYLLIDLKSFSFGGFYVELKCGEIAWLFCTNNMNISKNRLKLLFVIEITTSRIYDQNCLVLALNTLVLTNFWIIQTYSRLLVLSFIFFCRTIFIGTIWFIWFIWSLNNTIHLCSIFY